MQAHFFTHDVRHEESHEAVEGRGKDGAATGRTVKQCRYKFANRVKPTGKGNTCPCAEQENQQVFSGFDADFGEIPRRFLELQAFVTVAFDLVVNPQHDFGVNRLRARITAPQAAGDGRPPKQAEGANHQQ